MKKFFFVLFMSLVTAFLMRAQLLGIYLDPIIEKQLTEIFAMPIVIDGLRADPITGNVRINRLRFLNQPEFSTKPHIDAKEIKTQVDVKALFHQQVLIEEITMNELNYSIERKVNLGKAISNAKMMARGVKKFRRLRKEKKQKELEALGLKEDPTPGKDWIIRIRSIHFFEGSFEYRGETDGQVTSEYYFKNLKGVLDDFRRPSDPSVMNQTAKVQGNFGHLYPTPFWAEGKANFENSDISFNLKGKIQESPIDEYHKIFEGMQIQVNGGTFELEMEALCVLDQLTANMKLILKNLKLSEPPGVAQMLWGLPTLATLRFLETEKTITLNIPLQGVISDPKFDFGIAFQVTFQEALKHYTLSGIQFLREGPIRLAMQTQGLAAAASGKIAGGLNQASQQVTGLVKTPAQAFVRVLPQPNPKSQTARDQNPQSVAVSSSTVKP